MELFYSNDFDGHTVRLGEEESQHCSRVLRHRCGDKLNIMDGEGTLRVCRLMDDSPKGCTATVLESIPDWGGHPYYLRMAVCPTKNSERFEWFAEKATEIGIDCISPLVGVHSERRVFKGERLKRILLSACKQSLKARIPQLDELQDLSTFIREAPKDSLRLIACCFEDEKHPRRSVEELLEATGSCDICILIGPEGDFSHTELELALENGFIPVHLGASRLRTETAAIAAVAAVYFHFTK